MFRKNERSISLRNDILKRFIGLLMTDDEKAEMFSLPEGCRIREGAKILSPEKFKCGKYVWIGENAMLDASGGLEIGDHTSIGLGVLVWSHTSHLANLSMNNVIGSPLIIRKPTKIGSGCLIGGPSVIQAGVTIGDKVIVLPMSAVTKDVPDYTIVAGAPAVEKDKISEEWCKIRKHKDFVNRV